MIGTSWVYSQDGNSLDDKQLFEKVFGRGQSQQIIATEVRLVVGTEYVGDLPVKANALGEIIELSLADFLQVMRPKLSPFGLNKIEQLPASFKPLDLEALGVTPKYDSNALTLLLRLPIAFEKAQVSSWKAMVPEWAQNAQGADDWSVALNTAARQSLSYGQTYEGVSKSDTFVSSDLALQFHRWVLEASGDYSTVDSRFARRDVRLVRDFPAHLSRLQVGDLVYPVMGLQNSLALGGIGISRETTLDPYRIVTPLNDQEFYLSSKSLVKVYVNGQLVRSVFLSAGRHSLLDLPLNNGVNEIRLDIRDFYGEESTLTFKRFTSTKLLRSGFVEYSANVGVLRTDVGTERKYNEDHLGLIFNSFWRRGMTSSWTTGAFALTTDDRSNLGIENTLSTEIGVWSHELALSRGDGLRAGVISRTEYTYQAAALDGVGSRYQLSHEFLSPRYQNFLDQNTFQETAHIFRASQGFDLTPYLNVNLGAQYSLYRLGVEGYGANLSVSWRFLDDWLISGYSSRDRDNFSRWNESYYAFLTWNIPESGQSVTASYDGQNKLQRLDWISSPQSRLGSVEGRGSVQNDQTQTKADFQASYLGSRAQLSLEQEVTSEREQDKTFGTTTVGASFGLGIVPGGFAFGRPIRGSFAVVAPNEELEGSTIGVGTSTLEQEAEINAWGSALLPELASYQYTMLSVDARALEPGLGVGDESIVIYPGHRTGQLITIGASGTLMATGRLVKRQDADLAAVSLKVGVATGSDGSEIAFFTDREGNFFLEGLTAQVYILRVAASVSELDLRGQKRGLIKVSTLELR